VSKVDCNKEMIGFHAAYVTLGNTEQAEMRGRRDNGQTRLENGLTKDGHPQPKEFAPQGSYAMRTMVQDPECDYDIDDGVYFWGDDLRDSAGSPLSPVAARERVRAALHNDERVYPAEVKTNCVRQAYYEGYHIDMPVYKVTRAENGDEICELASGDSWVKSDARAVTNWFRSLVGELNQGAPDGSQMRRLVKLTKKFARSRADWKDQTTSGICITKLVSDHFVERAVRDDAALLATWKSIYGALSVYSAIDHPLTGVKKLAEPGDRTVTFFKEKLGWALGVLAVLDRDDCDRSAARIAWDEVFDVTYFSSQPTDDESGSKGGSHRSFVTASGATAQRDDGGRRYG
jgi:hypothetical protein